MSSQAGYSSSVLFQSINDDLTASLSTADELSKEFSSLMQVASGNPQQSWSQTSSVIPREKPQPLRTSSMASSMPSSTTSRSSGGSDVNNSSSMPYILTPTAQQPLDSITSPVFPSQTFAPPQVHKEPHMSSDGYTYRQVSPSHSPRTQRRQSPSRYDRSPRSSVSYMEQSLSPSASPTVTTFDQALRPGPFYPAAGMLSPYDGIQMGRRSPLTDRSPSPRPVSSTLPRNFVAFMPADEGVQRQKGKWNETDLDASYERKAHHTYDKKEWLRPSVPNSSWRESNLDGPPSFHNVKKDTLPRFHQVSHGSLPRNSRISVPPDSATPQPIISRISIPPVNTRPSQRRPIPLSVIMRLQNPRWASAPVHYPGPLGSVGQGDMPPYQPPMLLPRESLPQLPPQAPSPELRQPAFYSDALNPGDIDAELEGLARGLPVISETPGASETDREAPQEPAAAPRPLSPTRLQPVVAPEAQSQVIPDLEELLRVRAEIPRALKRRGSVDQSQPQKKASLYEPNQYKNLINNLFRRKGLRHKGEQESENGSSSEGEDSPALPPPASPLVNSTMIPQSYHSILRRSSRQHKNSGRRARLSPLVLLLDGSLVGEMDTVKRAVQEISDASQANDEGITALHNAICGGHYNVVDFLVSIGANVSAPDSHGWTPLHCAASCNDRPLCEFLVRNGAAVMAMTESDGATASQKCDPYAEGFEECESFLRGVEQAMGEENSGVLYALWNYPAQAADELSFKEGDMVTILQKPEGVDWWWASLCGREGFVPNNYFGLFPKVRPKSLC